MLIVIKILVNHLLHAHFFNQFYEVTNSVLCQTLVILYDFTKECPPVSIKP